MRHDDAIPGPVIARNTARVALLGLAISLVSGAAGVLVSRFTDAPPEPQALLGWAILGVVLFGFPIMMALLVLRR